jgi:hypothetical protein
MRTALIAVASVWILGCVWSYQEQSAFAASKGFTFPHLLPLVIDGFAVSMAGVAWAASLDARPAIPARLATLVAVAASSASNGVWAYLRADHDMVTVVLGVTVPIAANLAFEVLLAELRRQVQRRRGLPPPVAVPYPRMIRIVLAPWQTFRSWRSLVLEITAMDLAVSRSTGVHAPELGIPAGATVRASASVSPAPAPDNHSAAPATSAVARQAATQLTGRAEAALPSAAARPEPTTEAQPWLRSAELAPSPAGLAPSTPPPPDPAAHPTPPTQPAPPARPAPAAQPGPVAQPAAAQPRPLAHQTHAAYPTGYSAQSGPAARPAPPAQTAPAAQSAPRDQSASRDQSGPAARGSRPDQGGPTHSAPVRVSAPSRPTLGPHTDDPSPRPASAHNGDGDNGRSPERRPLDPRVVQLARHLATTEDADELTGEMVGRLLNIDVAPRTGRRLLGQARELVNRRARAEASGLDDPELSVIGGR